MTQGDAGLPGRPIHEGLLQCRLTLQPGRRWGSAYFAGYGSVF